MSGQSRQTLKSYFVTNAVPNQQQFADLIDSFVDMADDGISVSPIKNIGIADPAPLTQLSVKSQLVSLTGTLQGASGTSAITGIGTLFTKELKPNQAISVSSKTYTVNAIKSDTSLTINEKLPNALSGATGTTTPDIFSVNDAKGNPIIYTTQEGKTGFGTQTPVSTVEINGKLTAQQLAGDGTSLTNIQASAIQGVLSKNNLPAISNAQGPFTITAVTSETTILFLKNTAGNQVANVDASGNLLLSGNVNATRFIGDGSGLANIQSAKGPFTITSVCDKPITGTVKGNSSSNIITGTGTLFLTELKPRACLKINNDLYTIQSIESSTSLTIGNSLKSTFTGVSAYMETGMLALKNAAGINIGNVDTSGNFSAVGSVNANGLLSVTMDDRISGTVNGLKDTIVLNGKNTKFKTELKAGSLLKISNNIYKILGIGTDNLLTLTTPIKGDIQDVPAYTPTDTLTLNNNSYPLISTKADSWGNISAPGIITAQSFNGSGAGLTSINAAELVGTIPAECFGALPQKAISDAGLQIKVNLPKATLFNGEPAIINWTSVYCDSLVLEYMNGGQLCTLQTDKDQIALQQNNLSISLIDTTLFTLTAYRGSEPPYQQQFWITVMPTIEQRMQQWYSYGYDLLFAISDVCSRFKLTMLNTDNVTTVAKAAKAAGYDNAPVQAAIEAYYKVRGQDYDLNIYAPILGSIFK